MICCTAALPNVRGGEGGGAGARLPDPHSFLAHQTRPFAYVSPVLQLHGLSPRPTVPAPRTRQQVAKAETRCPWADVPVSHTGRQRAHSRGL